MEPPDQDGFKTNFDGAMFHDLGEAGIGVVIRKNKGEVMSLMTAMSEKIPPTPYSSWNIYHYGGDSEIVINSLWKNDMFHFAFGHLVKDALCKLFTKLLFLSYL